MKRIQLFEFADFSWFPSTIRSSMTKLIVVLQKMMGTPQVIANIVSGIKKAHPFSTIVDIGSGSGGVMPLVTEQLNQTDPKNPTSLLLTDLYPNKSFVESINNSANPHVSYSNESLDATNLNNTPEGLKTMINCFHHMPPDKARQILRSAQYNKQPLLIYELSENTIPLVLWWLFLPISLIILFIMVLFMTPFVKPLTWQQLLFTYIIPVIPIFYAWDGQTSMVRTYTFKDIETLLPNPVENYSWKITQAKNIKGKKAGYYISGLPKS